MATPEHGGDLDRGGATHRPEGAGPEGGAGEGAGQGRAAGRCGADRPGSGGERRRDRVGDRRADVDIDRDRRGGDTGSGDVRLHAGAVRAVRSAGRASAEERGEGIAGGIAARGTRTTGRPSAAESSRLDSGLDVTERQAPTHERVHLSHPRYQVVVTQCPDCGRAEAQTSRGAKPLGLPALQAVLCDARVHRNGEKNRATIPPARRREVLARDGYRCRASGCESAHFLDVHHVIPRERGGTNEPDNLITLCAACHRLIHERGLPMRTVLK